MKILSKMVSFNLIKDGEDGKPGPSLIYAGAWREDITYIKDDVVNHYVHQVRNGKKEFYLLKKPKSLGDDPYINNTQGSGDIWRRVEQHDLILARKIQADEIDTRNLIAGNLMTAKSGPRIEASGAQMEVYGFSEHPNIIFGVNDQGYAVLSYYDNEGNKLYDLGPNGLSEIKFAPKSWTKFKLAKAADYIPASDVTFRDLRAVMNPQLHANSPYYYKYYAGGNPTIPEEEKAKEKYTYETEVALKNYYIKDGWYYYPPTNQNLIPVYPTANTGAWVKPEEDALYNSDYGVIDLHPIHHVTCMLFKGGMIESTKKLMWNGDDSGYIPGIPNT